MYNIDHTEAIIKNEWPEDNDDLKYEKRAYLWRVGDV